jgi:hypothetical protein
LNDLQGNYEKDRHALENQIAALQTSKADLQCEVGMLLRDKRNVEEELRQVSKEWDQARDVFFKEIKSATQLEEKYFKK